MQYMIFCKSSIRLKGDKRETPHIKEKSRFCMLPTIFQGIFSRFSKVNIECRNTRSRVA